MRTGYENVSVDMPEAVLNAHGKLSLGVSGVTNHWSILSVLRQHQLQRFLRFAICIPFNLFQIWRNYEYGTGADEP